MMYWLTILMAVIVGFLFPANLIDALKLEDEEKARGARGGACVCFGTLVICIILLLGN